LDNYDNYATFRFVTYPQDHKIISLYLLLYSIHRLQSLDIGIFNPLIVYYDQFVKERNRYERKNVTKQKYIEWILFTRSKINNEKNIASVFTITDFVPFDPNRILHQLKKIREYTNRLITSTTFPE
jgi:hypothetical protein